MHINTHPLKLFEAVRVIEADDWPVQKGEILMLPDNQEIRDLVKMEILKEIPSCLAHVTPNVAEDL